MNQFTLVLQDATHSEQFDNVISFVGEDASGRFGILAGHDRLITSLVIGLAKFRTTDERWQYVAIPGAILYCKHNTVTVSTRKYLLDTDYTRISHALQQELLAEEEKLLKMKHSLHQMEEEIFRRMWEMGRQYGGA